MKSIVACAVLLALAAGASVFWKVVASTAQDDRTPERNIPSAASSLHATFPADDMAEGKRPSKEARAGDALSRPTPEPVEREASVLRSERAGHVSASSSVRNDSSRQQPHGASPIRMAERKSMAMAMEMKAGAPVKLPLFYSMSAAEISKQIPQLEEESVRNLQADFEQQAGVGVLEPEDPEYARRWKEAELSLEQRLRLWGGWAAWGAYEHQQAVIAYQQQKAAGETGK